VSTTTYCLLARSSTLRGYYGGDVTHGRELTSTPPLALAVSGANQTSKTALNFRDV